LGARSRPQLIVSHGKQLGTSSFITLVRFLEQIFQRVHSDTA
jgi:hypothetical protein